MSAGSACSALSLAFWSPGTSGPPRICSTTVRARARVPGCVGGSVGRAHHAEGGHPHCQQVTTRPGHSLACTFPLLFHCWLRENPLSCHSEESLTRGFAPPLSHGTRVGSGAEGYDSLHIENGTVLVLNIAPHISPTGVGVICSTEQGTISTQEFSLS